MNGWVKNSLTVHGWELTSEQEFTLAVNHLANVYEKLPKQLIHRDVHFGNFLFSHGEFSGYIDFDLSQRNMRVFDMAYFLAGLLTNENGSKLQENEWLQIIHSVISGYESIIKLQKANKGIPLRSCSLLHWLKVTFLKKVQYFQGIIHGHTRMIVFQIHIRPCTEIPQPVGDGISVQVQFSGGPLIIAVVPYERFENGQVFASGRPVLF